MLSIFAAISLAGAVAPQSTAPATDVNVLQADLYAQVDTDMQIISDTEIIIDGHTFNSWEAVASSQCRHQEGTRCGIDSLIFEAIDIVETQGSGADCTFSRTRIEPQYDPSVEKYRIPVVVHVIQQTNGTGSMTDSRVQSQIDILNEDFLAIPGTNGAPGTDVQIEFYLATEDPSGDPTTGITRSTNNTWFNDGGGYYNTLAWDTNRYLNIYTNNGGGALGYVPNLPQGGIAGSNSDRVVILYSTFGRNAPYSPFNLGRTATHEVGHYLGLDHTFAGGCSNSYTSGDLIMDTNPESSPTWGCPGSRSSCGSQAPIDNYMDYSDDRCMEKFTPEQANRMRCSLIHYRPNLYELAEGPCSGADISQPYGELDFFDVSGFIVQVTNQDPAADLTGDGTIDFFDVSAYLALFAAGCP
jgi:hypothetical protein